VAQTTENGLIMFSLKITQSTTARNYYVYTVTEPNGDTHVGGGPDWHTAWNRGTALIDKLKEKFSVVVEAN
jgi:hypothetical protein